MRLCRVYVPCRLLLIHPFRCVMLFLLVWSVTWLSSSSSLFFVLVSVVVIVVVAGDVVDVLLLLLFGCESRSGSDRACECLDAIGVGTAVVRRCGLGSVWWKCLGPHRECYCSQTALALEFSGKKEMKK